MIEWAQTYWYLCLIALLIGIATAAWIWLSARADLGTVAETEIEDRRPAAPPQRLEPAKPEIDVAQPVQFTAPVREPAPVVTPAATAASPAAAASEPAADRPAIAAAVGAPDDLSLIKGVGPKLNALLVSLGVTRFDQIAAWGVADIAEVDRFLGNFQGRIVRDSWVQQAGLLARGDHDAFAAKFGALGSEKR